MNSWLALITILFIGDSITAGLYVAPDDRFPSRVGAALGVSTVNSGCAGGTSRDFTEPLTSPTACALGGAWTLGAEGVEHQGMVIMLGANDSTGFLEFWPNTGEMGWVVETHEYVGRLLDIIERTDAPVFLITPPSLADSFPDEAHALIEEYRLAIFKIAELHERVWIGADATRLLVHPDDFTDTVHPNEQGLAKLADAVVDTVESNSELVRNLLEAQGITLP